MWGHYLSATIIAAGLLNTVPTTAADPAPGTVVIMDTSIVSRFGWTELANFDDQPQAWDAIMSPELDVSLRVLAGMFEASVEVGAIADRFEHFESFDADSIRVSAMAGFSTPAWACYLEFETFQIFEPGYGLFYIGLNTYDVRVDHRFVASIFPTLPESLAQASLTAGYVASAPDLLERNFARLEVEIVQPFANGFAFAIAPKIEFSDYLKFPGAARQDTVLGLRITPSYNFGGGVTLSLDSEGSVALSTRDIKSGETWSLTPILRLQKQL